MCWLCIVMQDLAFALWMRNEKIIRRTWAKHLYNKTKYEPDNSDTSRKFVGPSSRHRVPLTVRRFFVSSTRKCNLRNRSDRCRSKVVANRQQLVVTPLSSHAHVAWLSWQPDIDLNSKFCPPNRMSTYFDSRSELCSDMDLAQWNPTKRLHPYSNNGIAHWAGRAYFWKIERSIARGRLPFSLFQRFFDGNDLSLLA